MQKNLTWQEMEDGEFYQWLWKANDEREIERLFLSRVKSPNRKIAAYAKQMLLTAWVFGSFKLGDEQVGEKIVKIEKDYPNFEKISALAPIVILDANDLNCLLYLSMEYQYDVRALEAALLSVEDVGSAKFVLYFLYRDGVYKAPVADRDVVIHAPELKTEEKYKAFVEKNADFIQRHDLENWSANAIYDQLAEFEEFDDTPTLEFWEEYCGIHNFIWMRLYLFGEYNGPMYMGGEGEEYLRFPEKKNLEDAINLIPEYFKSIYASDKKEREEMEFFFTRVWLPETGYFLESYLPDLELKELVEKMREDGYHEKDISWFATKFVEQLLSYEDIFYSSMYLRLFGKQSSGVDVDIPNIKNFEEAISLIPEYITFLTTVYESNYIEGTADLDEALHEYIQAMRRESFGKGEQLRFAAAWLNAIEMQGKISLNLMAVYLSGQFKYKGYKFETKIALPEKKSLEKALSIIPEYIQYLIRYSHPCWDDGVGIYPTDTLAKELIPTMREAGYEESEIDIFRAAFLSEIEKQEFSDYFVYDQDEESIEEEEDRSIDFKDMLF